MMQIEELLNFIRERHKIRERKIRGDKKPWTDDPIFQQYRFCNVYRELDTQTVWLEENWGSDDKDFWFAALVFRVVNWHETAEEIGFPLPWDAKNFVSVLTKRKARGSKVYSGVYIISTHGAKEEKSKYLAKSLSNIWEKREYIRYKDGELLQNFHQRLMGCYDVGSFISAQVIADAKHFGCMRYARDWFTFAASGPGSRRGLNRVVGNKVNEKLEEAEWKRELDRLHSKINVGVSRIGMRPLDAQNLQNCLCEFDKYERIRLGEGKVRSRYKGV